MLRVVAGRYKGRRLAAPEGERTKPTKDMVKEALFSSLGPLYGKTFLDLFAGSGSIGIEALSRGADSAVFVDSDPEAVAVIRSNLQILSVEERVIQEDVLSYLLKAEGKFDIVFLDPPYHYPGISILFERLQNAGILNKNAIIMYEAASDEKLEKTYGKLSQFKDKKYGISRLLYYREEN